MYVSSHTDTERRQVYTNHITDHDTTHLVTGGGNAPLPSKGDAEPCDRNDILEALLGDLGSGSGNANLGISSVTSQASRTTDGNSRICCSWSISQSGPAIAVHWHMSRGKWLPDAVAARYSAKLGGPP